MIGYLVKYVENGVFDTLDDEVITLCFQTMKPHRMQF